MEWTGAIILWILAGLILVTWATEKVWRELGRHRDQRRTEARLHEEGKRRLLRARDKVKAELRTNGAASSEHTRGTPPGQRP
jgi:hypothetical protein